MTNWQITQNPNFPHRYAVKKYSGYITTPSGKKIYLEANTVMIDDKENRETGTLFTPSEWKEFEDSGFDMQLYFMKKIFDVDILKNKP